MEIKSLALGFKEGIVLKGESDKNLINQSSVGLTASWLVKTLHDFGVSAQKQIETSPSCHTLDISRLTVGVT